MIDIEPKAKVLLVEGPEDREALMHFLRYHGIQVASDKRPGDLYVVDAGGFEKLRKRLPAEVVASGRTHVGIVVDADDSPAGRWQSLRDRLNAHTTQPLSIEPLPEGFRGTTADGVCLGIWLMPDNCRSGMIEDFLIDMVQPEDQWLLNHARGVVSALPANQRRFRESYTTKAITHTWLAWQQEPGKPLGTAITKRYFRAEGAKAACMLSWIRAMFDLPAAEPA
jgi:hypothetical protein